MSSNHVTPYSASGRFTVEQVGRFWAKVDRRSTSECWPWLAYLTPAGYGRWNYRWDGPGLVASRASWMIHHGEEVPEGLQIDHLCRNRACVNPAHLEAVTHAENMRRVITDVCGEGHRIEGANVALAGKRRHQCRTCVNARARERRAARKVATR